jgi:hypothetical protein
MVAVFVGVSLKVKAGEGVVRTVGNNWNVADGIGLGVSALAGGRADSASASEIPPTTRMMEMTAMITPPPS